MLSDQTTNPATNTVTGTPTDVRLSFDCANSPPAPTITGINTLLPSVSTVPVPDVIAIAATPATPFPGPGILGVDPTTRQGAFAVSAINVRASASLIATATTGGAPRPVTVALCQPSATGACMNSSGAIRDRLTRH